MEKTHLNRAGGGRVPRRFLTRWAVAGQSRKKILTPHSYVLDSQELPRVSVMIYYWMVNCQIAMAPIDVAGALREWTLYSVLSASSQRNSKGAKVTTCELQWSYLSCCSIPVWAPGDHSHPDQWSSSPRSCQSACRPHKTTRRWLERKTKKRKPRGDQMSFFPEQQHRGVWLIWERDLYGWAFLRHMFLFLIDRCCSAKQTLLCASECTLELWMGCLQNGGYGWVNTALLMWCDDTDVPKTLRIFSDLENNKQKNPQNFESVTAACHQRELWCEGFQTANAKEEEEKSQRERLTGLKWSCAPSAFMCTWMKPARCRRFYEMIQNSLHLGSFLMERLLTGLLTPRSTLSHSHSGRGEAASLYGSVSWKVTPTLGSTISNSTIFVFLFQLIPTSNLPD